MKGVLQIVIKVLCLLVGIASFAYVIEKKVEGVNKYISMFPEQTKTATAC